MKLHIKAIRLELTPSIETFINQKIGALARFLARFDERGSVEIWVEVARTTRHHHKGEVYSAKADIVLPHRILRATHAGSDLRVALDRVRDTLRIEIKKYKEEITARPHGK